MTDLSADFKALAQYRPTHKVRFVTAASLFDGHDAAINIMRRILQSMGAEVIHLGHNRSVEEVVTAALQEDAQGIAISSYQGGHVEYFKYMVDLLKARGGAHIQVFGGGGGVIVPPEIRELQAYGVARIFSPEDGQRMGLAGMIGEMVQRCDQDLTGLAPTSIDAIQGHTEMSWRALAQLITALENESAAGQAKGELSKPLTALAQEIRAQAATKKIPVLGITGTGGAGKSSLTDELIRRLRLDQNDSLRIAMISIDPSRRKSGGALLGDRIRMNAISPWNMTVRAQDSTSAGRTVTDSGQRVFMRSLATRDFGSEISAALPDVIAACKVAGFDLIVVETSGIGQGDAAIVPHVDVPLYVMTPEFGAASQLEKIDMLDFAEFVAINKFDRKGALDALRDVAKQVQRNKEAFGTPIEQMPVFGTMAARFNDDGVTALYQALRARLGELGLPLGESHLPTVAVRHSTNQTPVLPAARTRYLAEISETVRAYKKRARSQAKLAREVQQLSATAGMLLADDATRDGAKNTVLRLAEERRQTQDPAALKLLAQWPTMQSAYAGEEYVVKMRDKEIRTALTSKSLSGTTIRKVCLPQFEDHGEILKWLMLDNVPGSYPYTAGTFAFKREGEDPTRMFAGEGDAFRTNTRFKLLSSGMAAKRLSTAFDSVTLYGNDPDPRPDIYGKVGNSGVSIATLDDLKVLYSGFDLCSPSTSVSMTINGPAPSILAMFMNTAIDQNIDKFKLDNGREPTDTETEKIKEWVQENVRGTVQADILKEDQGQNTCIFSTEFSLKVMGDIAEYFVHNRVRNFYSVSISGYHIAEAGANPISQLAFTLSNGFTFVEAYLARGMHIDDFAPNLSFFFSNGMDPEYTVMGRVARRIWAVAMKERYGANERSQKLKYHIQTSGRSLHAQEIQFNDIRTTLQALIAIYDNCNSLHTNAFDEAITTPTEDSVRRAMAIQLIINREWGLAKNENPSQGAFIIEDLTELVEEAVLLEFERISERGGVLGAMETGYQRGKIQDESMHYEMLKHTGELPIIGVNTFRNPHGDAVHDTLELARSTDEEKQSQLQRLADFHALHAKESPAMLKRLQKAVIDNKNVFEVLMDAVRCCSLGQITNALFEVGGQYRRNM
ncbi:MAG: methylmalonyl-CoA mutase family protein [Gammaproteobacteria bacterium]|uniref:fused isobutyryl-CoA mutase/GTPase IcmF n=1 Tax=Rhodoferax sp. TaxID=50421 RepID=UPI0017E63DC4|nr:fused isobutyryl-CoA mutase/GTPase IcmF [Rhodoferax sp.]MBU3900607.1 methylmalonyl-CoA mutase family protein [Gammaproteobacteria bacterium]MBA3059098.1 methylmalonyl-CoA mutase family protein [Rhodoferax sp.]MBU3996730.1 methylmalonyl-CoA mutase family protein [Gammaproteobacteria bacterium]MBU4081017.1 methylmalonyl-CoA mutase family protein [Gammaproteobacteria bacterium]MBU4113171.1 methylmalonyl-CoA mutase family protein [Gammaproteobacteria bacterium]